MSVRLGEIELTRLQGVEVDEGRNLVEHRVPGGSGSVFQDLGRGSLRLTMTGLLLGEAALQEIETLRGAQADATPMQFSGDIAVGSELTDVIIEDFRVEQVPGYTFRYQFVLRVREWTEPPAPAGAALAAVDSDIAADAAGWNDSALALGGALDDPGGLAGLISGDGSLLSRIDIGELAQAVIGAIGGLDPSDFAHLLSAITGVDAGKLNDLISALAEADSLADVFAILADGGLDVLGELAGIDLSAATDLVKGLIQGPEFIDKLDKVRKAAGNLLDQITGFDPLGPLQAIAAGPSVSGGGA